ncbi:hypothetical protein A2U01_0089438, partial [Trifolium medium]|nr:hypothetical protein [Trifolium medium]
MLSHNLSSRLHCSYKSSSLTRTQNSVRVAGCDEDDATDDFVTPNFDLYAN